VDVRPQEEWAEWRIPGSVHVDVYDALKAGQHPEMLAALDLPGDQPVVTVCGAGKTSLLAAAQLQERGFQARSLAGGMKAWSLAWNSAEVPVEGSSSVLQVRRTGKGCLSYLIGANDVAMVIDPSLAPDVYLRLAEQHGWRIMGVLETHVHADHLSRGKMLAELTGATLYLPAQDRVAFSYAPVQDGDVLKIGSARLTALRTPGHTLESTCYLLDDRILFTGDTLFLKSVGRPDLEANPEQAHQRAHLLYHSLQILLALPAHIQVLPGHISEPVAFDEKPVMASLATVAQQTALLHASEEEFVAQILQRIPPTPPNHQRIVVLNEAGVFPGGDPTELEAGANRCAVG
jgi:glyoxylase-like metal-dependent hydrolase (beta-lactamase superfamily II)